MTTPSSISTLTVYRNSNSPYANSNTQIPAAPPTPAVSAFTDNNSEFNHDFKRSRTATIVSAITQSIAPCDTVSAINLPAVPKAHSSPELEPKQATSTAREHDGLQPLSTYYVPHEYVDVNGVKNKGFAPVAPPGMSQRLLKLSPADGQRICGLKRSMLVFLVVLAIIIGLAVGLGAGLGLGLKQGNKNAAEGGGLSAACSASPTSPPSSSSSSSSSGNNGSGFTSSPTTHSPSPSSPSSSTLDSAVSGLPHLTCPSFNGTIIASPLSPTSSPSSFSPRSSQNKKYMILCDTNLAPSPSKQDLVSFHSQTLEECFAVCDSMSFYMKREDVSAVWNYLDEKGPGRGGCWCVGKKEDVEKGMGGKRVMQENKGVSVVVVGVDEAGRILE